MVVRHSQSAQVPECPSNMVKLWDGYSLLMMQGNDHGYHQDLGKYSYYLKTTKETEPLHFRFGWFMSSEIFCITLFTL
jgi:hypothetical protein